MLSIGQFSKTCMVTVKALRHYDEIGLLKPALVNADTGYRLYSEGQIPQMLLINKLKYYGFSLSDIRAILSDGGDITPLLKKQRDALNASIAHTAEIISELDGHIRNLERTGNVMSYQNNYEIEIVETEDLHVIACRQNMSVDEYGKYYGILYKRVADENIVLDGTCLAMYHDREFDPENSDIELALGVADKTKADKIIPGMMCAAATHIGAYSKLPEAYGALTKWISENGYKIAAPPYEIYAKTHFDKIPADEWETRIFFPVKTAE